ncbi:bacterial extracellular solute-binding protein [Clostridium sp. CAG:448]|nr:bacterial extracellular solute-binding protein [Clostridium sp. CAG:448]
MKTRFMCLVLCALMLFSAFLTGCANTKSDSEVTDDIVDKASNNATTLTMWVQTERKVCNTDEELAAYLKDECDNNPESEKYKEAVAVKEAYDAVEAAFTKITKSKFKTNVDLLFYTADEYYDKLEAAIQTYEDQKVLAAKAALALKKVQKQALVSVGNNKAKYNEIAASVKKQFMVNFPDYAQFLEDDNQAEETTEDTAEETVVNEYGFTELKYPDVLKNQVDIIYLSGYNTYKNYIEKEWIQDLNEELSGASRKLKYYISSTLLSGIQMDGNSYAIPNNVAIGEYNYMLINKELFDRYYYDIADIKDILDCKNYLSDLAKQNETLADADKVLPIDATFEECMRMLVWYWDMDYEKIGLNETLTNAAIQAAKDRLDAQNEGKPDDQKKQWDNSPEALEKYNVYDYSYKVNDDVAFSIMGTVYGGADKRTRGSVRLAFDSLFTSANYRNDIFLPMMKYKYEGYFGSAADGQTCGITFMKGDSSVLTEYDKNGYYTAKDGTKYYPVIAEYPEATEQDLYGNMFAVSSYSRSVSRSMEIITYLNTNTDLRNVLQYGVEGVNYELDENGVLRRTSKNLYQMDIKKTGNEFIAHPEEGMPANMWDMAKLQNNNALINPLLGFDFNQITKDNGQSLDVRILDDIREKSKSALERINAIETDEQYQTTTERYNALSDLVEQLAQELKTSNKENGLLMKAASKEYDCAEKGDTFGESPYTVYYAWLVQYGYDVKSAAIDR